MLTPCYLFRAAVHESGDASRVSSIGNRPSGEDFILPTEIDRAFDYVVLHANASGLVDYHADFADPRWFSAMLSSINNMATHFENELQDYDIRIVFVAHGIRIITDDKLQNTPFAEDDALAERRGDVKNRLLSLNNLMSVKLELCDTTRSQINLAREKMYEPVEFVHSGVVQISELKKQGFAYIKVDTVLRFPRGSLTERRPPALTVLPD